MACLYEMNETNIPFKEVQYSVTEFFEKKGEDAQACNGFPFRQKVWNEPEKVGGQRGFYTLTVCKACRGSWIGAIQEWFNEPKKERVKVGSGIFVRENGTSVEITEEEWNRRNPGREPVRYRG